MADPSEDAAFWHIAMPLDGSRPLHHSCAAWLRLIRSSVGCIPARLHVSYEQGVDPLDTRQRGRADNER